MKERWFVTGDLHGALHSITNFIEKYNLGEGDNIIVLGDVALAWRKDLQDYNFKIEQYERWCNGVHLYWIEGNHENFDIIKGWNCYRNIYDNSKHIHYCSRGSILNINGKKALCIGGADSVDRIYRTEGLDWWKEEQITKKDIANISGHFDYVFSHCCPKSIFDNNKAYLCTLTNINEENAIHKSEQVLETLKTNITYNKWFFAHYHIDRKLDDKHQCIFNDFVELT